MIKYEKINNEKIDYLWKEMVEDGEYVVVD